MWRFLLFKFLPRRLLPLLALYEVIQLIRRLRRDDHWTEGARWREDDGIIEGRATPVPPRAVDGGPTTSP